MKKLLLIVILNILFHQSYFAQWSGNALYYDGVNDYVNFGQSIVFNVDTAVTYEFWIKPDSGASGFIFNKWVGFQEDKQITYSGGIVGFYLFNVFGGAILYSKSSIPERQYTHIAATYNGSVAKIYLNGVLDTSKTVGNGVKSSFGNFFTGFNPDRDWIYPYEGIIDEFRIWNVARTESEIQSTMYMELNGNEFGLIGYWNFDEGVGTITADQTINGNNGTISGATWVISGITNVEESNSSPNSYNLSQNYPNPFNPSTTIEFSIPNPGLVQLKVFNILGQEVKSLMNEEKSAGNYSVQFNASQFASGIYFYQLQAGSPKGHAFVETKKMLMLK